MILSDLSAAAGAILHFAFEDRIAWDRHAWRSYSAYWWRRFQFKGHPAGGHTVGSRKEIIKGRIQFAIKTSPAGGDGSSSTRLLEKFSERIIHEAKFSRCNSVAKFRQLISRNPSTAGGKLIQC